MATLCPKCGKANLKKGDKYIYCGNYEPFKDEKGEWQNSGSCDFKINFENKIWGKALTPAEIKEIVEGKVLTNKRGDTIVLDLKNKFYTTIEKKADEDL